MRTQNPDTTITSKSVRPLDQLPNDPASCPERARTRRLGRSHTAGGKVGEAAAGQNSLAAPPVAKRGLAE